MFWNVPGAKPTFDRTTFSHLDHFSRWGISYDENNTLIGPAWLQQHFSNDVSKLSRKNAAFIVPPNADLAGQGQIWPALHGKKNN